jgi:hypothetical protein
MTIVINAPQHYTLREHEFSVFLAGAIDMGAAIDWQRYVINNAQGYENLVLFNPRRANFTPKTLDGQIRWELKYLDAATMIFMWLPKDSKAPVSMLEAGLFWHSGKLVIGAEDGFYRQRNLELTAEHYKILLHNNLDEMISCIGLYYYNGMKP